MNEVLENILNWIYSWLGNYGWSMVVFTLLLRLVLFPFDYKSRVGMRKMSKIGPMQQALQKKYANDKETLNRKLGELYRKERVNPLSSCLPMLLTLPIMFAMWGALRSLANEQLAIQAFDILMGKTPQIQGWLWVKNIWMPDSPFAALMPDLGSLQQITGPVWQKVYDSLGAAASALPQTITYDFSQAALQTTIRSMYDTMVALPAYAEAVSLLPGGTFNFLITTVSVMREMNGWFVLPVLAAVTSYLQSAMNPAPTPAEGKSAANGNFMKWFFPIFSLWICSGYNAAFSLYWVASNVIAAGEMWLINMYLDHKEKREATVGEGSVR